MQVNPTTPTGGVTTSGTTQTQSSPQTVNYEAFLQLLIAEMQNQDPTNPMDSSEYISQLASFSAVEQAVQTNAKLDSLLVSSALSNANSLIGRTVTSADGATRGTVESIRLNDSGAIAVLDTGKEITVGTGVKVE